MVLAVALTQFRLFITTGVGVAFLLFLHEAIRVQRPDIVDHENRVRGVDIEEILDSYDFVIVGGGSAGWNTLVNCDKMNLLSFRLSFPN